VIVVLGQIIHAQIGGQGQQLLQDMAGGLNVHIRQALYLDLHAGMLRQIQKTRQA